MKRLYKIFLSLAIITALCFSCVSCLGPLFDEPENTRTVFSLDAIPAFDGETPYIAINDNKPFFEESELQATVSYEKYSDLDSLGRCGEAIALIGRDIMPTEDRGSIGQVKPSGWHTVKYDVVDGKYLYNRCHLIGFQLTGENANVENLITGTRYLNIDGMLEFENMIADFVKETNMHVLYRVTPIFDGRNLVASGVLMEARSIEDGGKGIEFCVYAYNAQPGITIDYATGASALRGQEIKPEGEGENPPSEEILEYVINLSSKKFHKPDCQYADDIKEGNKAVKNSSSAALIDEGYSPCGSCKP